MKPEWAQEFACGLGTPRDLEVGGLGATLREMCFGGNSALGKGAGPGLCELSWPLSDGLGKSCPLGCRDECGTSTSQDFRESEILT